MRHYPAQSDGVSRFPGKIGCLPETSCQHEASAIGGLSLVASCTSSLDLRVRM